jgi:hypothetical protein
MIDLKGKGTITLILTLLLCLPFFIGIVKAATPISSCQNITSSGSYVLTQNLTSGFCIDVEAPNVNLDLGGYSIMTTLDMPLLTVNNTGFSLSNGNLLRIYAGNIYNSLISQINGYPYSLNDVFLYSRSSGGFDSHGLISTDINMTDCVLDVTGGSNLYGLEGSSNSILRNVTVTSIYSAYALGNNNQIYHSYFSGNFYISGNYNFICNTTITVLLDYGSFNIITPDCPALPPTQQGLYSTYANSSFCIASTITPGNPVTCVTPSFMMPSDCQNITATVTENDTTSFCFGQFKSNYLANPGYASVHGLQQILYADCGDTPHSSSLTNNYLTTSDSISGNCTLQPYSNQTGSLLCIASATCNIPNPIIDFLFPNPSYFGTVYGTDFALSNAIINNGLTCQDVTLTGSNPNFFRLGAGQDAQTVITQLGGASHLGNTLNFHICPNETDWFFAYFSPSTYGLSNNVANYNLTVTASVGGTAIATKHYNTLLNGTFIPIGECNNNGVCELGESHDFCPNDCQNEGQIGVVPCTTGNCTNYNQVGTSTPVTPLVDTGNGLANIFLTPNALWIIGSLVAAIVVMYYIGKGVQGIVPMFAGALLFLVFMALGTYYAVVINWVGALLVIIAAGFSVYLGTKLLGFGGH